MYIYTRFGSARGFSAVYFRVDPAKLLYNALSLPVNHNVVVVQFGSDETDIHNVGCSMQVLGRSESLPW